MALRFRKIVFHRKIINKIRTANKENSANRFGESCLENSIINFLWDTINHWRAAALSVSTGNQFFYAKLLVKVL